MKRIVDIVLSLLALVVLSPILLIVAVLVWVNLGSPVFFKQMRPGRYGRPFTILKFRTMTGKCDLEGHPLSDGDRLTAFGRSLRSTSLDELPELWNVLMGDMSLVGPRPLLMEYLALYTPEQARRHEVRPGITGWAQIKGRNAISWDERFALDTWYIDHRSFALDLWILAKTFVNVARRRGIAAVGKATVERFSGSRS